MTKKRFQIALSFAGEHRNYVEQVAKHLAEKLGEDAVFYDNWYTHELARPNLDSYLQNIYHQDSDLIVPFVCADYERKDWCGLEWRAIRDLIKQRKDEDIMPMRFDNTHITGLFGIDGYLDVSKRTAEETASLILKRLHLNNGTTVQPVTSTTFHHNHLPTDKRASRNKELLDMWEDRLFHFEKALTVCSDDSRKFSIQIEIEECQKKIEELKNS